MKILVVILLLSFSVVGVSQDNSSFSNTTSQSLNLISSGFFANEQMIFSIGETVTGNIASESYQISQGFIQNQDKKENKVNQQFICQLFPNPTSETIYLILPDFLNTENTYSYLIFDTKGSTITFGDINISNPSINVKSLANGQYYVQIKNKHQQFIQTNSFIKI